MTYAELAAARRISSASAFKLALRHKWQRQKNNMGQVTVLVPSDWVALQGGGHDAGYDVSRHITAFEAALAAVREAKDGEIAALRNQLRALQAANGGQISLLRDHLAHERARGDRLEDRIAAAEADRDAARADAARAQAALDRSYGAENERRGRGRWRRLRAAWPGE